MIDVSDSSHVLLLVTGLAGIDQGSRAWCLWLVTITSPIQSIAILIKLSIAPDTCGIRHDMSDSAVRR